MEMSRRKLLGVIAIVVLATAVPIGVLATVSRMVILFPQYYQVEEHWQHIVGKGDANTQTMKIGVHSTVRQWRWIDGQKYLIFEYHHPAALTVIGENWTAGKIAGAVFPTTDYMENCTYISMGIDVGLTTSSTQLPGEWNRSTSLTPEYIGVGQWNYTYSFYPSGSGITNSTGLNWKSTGDNNLWAYDTFSDISYTSNDQIDVEFGTDIQYS